MAEKKMIRLNGRYIRDSRIMHERLKLAPDKTAFVPVDVYYCDQTHARWGDPADPFTKHLQSMERKIHHALRAARQIGIRVIYAMNSAPRIGIRFSEFGRHFARAWGPQASADSFEREFAEGGVDSREFHTGKRSLPLQIPPSLRLRKEDLYIRKHAYSAFFDTRLDTALRNLGIRTIVCAGLWANVCMAATALDALYRNYRVVWLRDATLAGETGKESDGLADTKKWIAWFEEIIGYTVESEEFAKACLAVAIGN